MLIPACPKAGPTGGAGVAFPAGICNLTTFTTFFATVKTSSSVCGSDGHSDLTSH